MFGSLSAKTLKNALTGAAGIAAVCFAPSANAALVVTKDADAPTAWDLVDETQSTTLPSGASWVDEPSTRTGNDDGLYRSPFDDTDVGSTFDGDVNAIEYFAVGPDNPSNPAVLKFDSDQTFLSFLWGSVDSFNEVTFKDEGGGVVGVANNTDVGAGNPTGRGASLVSFGFDEGETFRTVEFFSDGSNALEFSNIVGSGEQQDVPVPATFALLGAGLVGLGAIARRRR